MNSRREPTSWLPSQEAWKSVEDKAVSDYGRDVVRREWLNQKSIRKGIKHGGDDPQRHAYEEMRFDRDTPPILVGEYRGVYEIVDGTHRYRGAKLKRINPIPAIVVRGLHT